MFNESTGGVLGGTAMDAIAETKDAISTKGDGWTFECFCQRCGQEHSVTVSWTELIQASERIVPVDEHGHPWTHHEGRLFPPVFCGCDGNARLPIFIVPDKAQRCIKAGISSGVVSPQAVAGIVNQIRARHPQRR